LGGGAFSTELFDGYFSESTDSSLGLADEPPMNPPIFYNIPLRIFGWLLLPAEEAFYFSTSYSSTYGFDSFCFCSTNYARVNFTCGVFVSGIF